MRTTTKYDYVELHRQYIHGIMSIRGLCRDNKLGSAWSTIAARARKEKWDEDREAFKLVERTRSDIAVADARAKKLAEIDTDVLEVIHAAVLQLGISLSDREVQGENGPYIIPAIQVQPNDLVKLIDKLQLLKGLPTSTVREEHLGFGLNINATGDAGDLPADLLRRLAEVARGKGAGAGPVGHAPLIGIEGAKSVN